MYSTIVRILSAKRVTNKIFLETKENHTFRPNNFPHYLHASENPQNSKLQSTENANEPLPDQFSLNTSRRAITLPSVHSK